MVDPSQAIRVKEQLLRETVSAIFRKMNVTADDADIATDVLVAADLRGVESHGVSNMLRLYVRGYRLGELNARPNWRVLRETPSTANIESDAGLGIILVPKAMEMAIEKAKKVGMGVVTLRNGRHLGMASYHAMMALKHDMIGMCMTSCPVYVVPTFGAEARLGTNPIAIAAPANKEVPFVFDAAMSTIPGNKLSLANRLKSQLMPGWVAAPDGTPIMEYSPAPPLGADGIPQAYLLPLGSTRELGSHKGYGLIAMVDILGGVLSGGGYGLVPGRPNFGHYVAAYSIEAFMDTLEFKDKMDEFLTMLRTTKTAPGHDRVIYAGILEAEAMADRKANGIPYHPEVIEWFKGICRELGIAYNLT